MIHYKCSAEKVKLIVSDLDGTLLLFGARAVSLDVKKYISSVIDRGIHFAVSSGRTYGELVSFLPEFSNDIYFICCDGAHYLMGDRSLYEKPISRSDYDVFFDGYDCIFHGDKENYALGNIPPSTNSFAPIKITKPSDIDSRIYKISVYGKKIDMSGISGLRMHWDGRDGITQLVCKFANKGAALSDLQTRLMVTTFDTAAMGDSDNDIPMLKCARHAFAIGDRLKLDHTENVASVIDAFDLIFAK